MEFRPASQAAINQTGDGDNLFKENLTDEIANLWKAPTPDMSQEEKYIDRFLQTDLQVESLQNKLFYISQEAQSVFEEQGYTVLYLAIRFLEWKEHHESIDTRRAPLILIPVELERTKVRASYELRWTGEDVYTNISLKEKLAEQQCSMVMKQVYFLKSSFMLPLLPASRTMGCTRYGAKKPPIRSLFFK